MGEIKVSLGAALPRTEQFCLTDQPSSSTNTQYPSLEVRSSRGDSFFKKFNESAYEATYLMINGATVGLGGWLLDKLRLSNRVDKDSAFFKTGSTLDDIIGLASLRPSSLLRNLGANLSSIGLSLKRTGFDVVSWTRNVVSATGLASRAVARSTLGEKQATAANRFFRGATSKCSDYEVAKLSDGTTRLSYFAKARNEGYGKHYVQIIDVDGNVLQDFKDTLGPRGLLERKWLRGGP